MQEGAGIEHIEVSNCLVKPVGSCEPVLSSALQMTTIERQLLQDMRALCAPTTAELSKEDAALLLEEFGSNCCVLQLGRVGPLARNLGVCN